MDDKSKETIIEEENQLEGDLTLSDHYEREMKRDFSLTEEQALHFMGKPMAELSQEEIDELNTIVKEQREKYIESLMQKQKRDMIPQSYFTKKGPGKGKKQKRNRVRGKKNHKRQA